MNCSRRFTTYEKIETIPIMVIKKIKVVNLSVGEDSQWINALLKKAVSITDLEGIVNEIESHIYNSTQKRLLLKK